MSERAFLTPEEVSERLGFSPETVYEALESGELPAIKLGPSYRIPEDELDEWIQRQLGQETGGADSLALENENVSYLPDTPKPGIQEPQRQVGVATRYSPHRGKGFGFITAEDGRDVFLRGSEARDLEIETGDVVEFVTVPGRPYPVARKVRLLEKSMFKQHPDAEKLYKDALDAQQLGYSERARRLFTEAIDKGAFLLIFTTFVEMERKLNRPQHALEVARQGIEVFPRVGKLYYMGAELLLQIGKREEALALLRAGIEHAPSFYDNHRLYIDVLMSKATPHSLRIAIEHSRRLGEHTISHASLDDPLLCFLRGPELPHDAYRFFLKAGFSIAIEQTCGQYVDFFVTSGETEYVDTYGLYRRVWVRCFSGSDYEWEDIHAFFEAWQDLGASEKALNLDVSFAVMRDAAPLRHIFYRILTDSKSAIVPFKSAIVPLN